MEKHDSQYTLVVNKKRILVTKEVYKAYYQQKEREVYLDKLSGRYNLSLEECDEKGIQVEYAIASAEDSMEDTIILNEMIAKMLDSLELLDINERQLIDELYFNERGECYVAAQFGITQQAINKRKAKILDKLKKLLEIYFFWL